MPCVDFQTRVFKKTIRQKCAAALSTSRRPCGPLTSRRSISVAVSFASSAVSLAPHGWLAHHVLDDRRKRASVAVAVAADGRARRWDNHASDQLRSRLRSELRELLPRKRREHALLDGAPPSKRALLRQPSPRERGARERVQCRAQHERRIPRSLVNRYDERQVVDHRRVLAGAREVEGCAKIVVLAAESAAGGRAVIPDAQLPRKLIPRLRRWRLQIRRPTRLSRRVGVLPRHRAAIGGRHVSPFAGAASGTLADGLGLRLFEGGIPNRWLRPAGCAASAWDEGDVGEGFDGERERGGLEQRSARPEEDKVARQEEDSVHAGGSILHGRQVVQEELHVAQVDREHFRPCL